MSAFAHTLLTITGYIVAILIGCGYLDIGFLLLGAGGDLKYLAAPKIHRDNPRVFPFYWGELTDAAKIKGQRRLPLAIAVYAISWVAYLVAAFFIARDLLPGVIRFFADIH